jgi:hypothetical protein
LAEYGNPGWYVLLFCPNGEGWTGATWIGPHKVNEKTQRPLTTHSDRLRSWQRVHGWRIIAFENNREFKIARRRSALIFSGRVIRNWSSKQNMIVPLNKTLKTACNSMRLAEWNGRWKPIDGYWRVTRLWGKSKFIRHSVSIGVPSEKLAVFRDLRDTLFSFPYLWGEVVWRGCRDWVKKWNEERAGRWEDSPLIFMIFYCFHCYNL